MSERAWALLCEVIEFPRTFQFADLIDRLVVQELADRGLIAIVRSKLAHPVVVATREGVYEYWTIN